MRIIMRMSGKFKPKNITIPEGLDAEMLQFTTENWSAVARRAFEMRIEELKIMTNSAIIRDERGSAACRICGLHFVVDSEDDQRQHREMHQELKRGSLPVQVREILKGIGWAIAHNDGGIERLKARTWEREDGKRSVAFAWWARARENGIKDSEFEPFMAACLRLIDAHVEGDQARIEAAQQALSPWGRYC